MRRLEMCKNIHPETTNFWMELSAVSNQRKTAFNGFR
jgi:hypothetical protein